jgi:glutathione S-transferase
MSSIASAGIDCAVIASASEAIPAFAGTTTCDGVITSIAPFGSQDLCARQDLSRLDYLENYLKGREFLLDHFSVADAYLVTVINWTMATPPIELVKWPTVKAYYERLRARPSVAKAVAEEFKLYQAEQARHKAAA